MHSEQSSQRFELNFDVIGRLAKEYDCHQNYVVNCARRLLNKLKEGYEIESSDKTYNFLPERITLTPKTPKTNAQMQEDFERVYEL